MTTKDTDYSSYLRFASELAAECGLAAAGQFGESISRRKGDGTLVTKTDEMVDVLITQRINAAYPSHAILSEEQSTIYDGADEYTWVVDPLDGTTNFARGLPIWGVSIALLHCGAPVVGVVDFPLLREQYTTCTGGGAQRNGQAIATAAGVPVDDQQFIMKCTRTDRQYELRSPLKIRVMGSAAYHICKIADGSALAGVEATPKIWDVAAAYLILVEAGGLMTAANGDPIFPLAAQRADYAKRPVMTFSAASPAAMQHLAASLHRRQR